MTRKFLAAVAAVLLARPALAQRTSAPVPIAEPVSVVGTVGVAVAPLAGGISAGAPGTLASGVLTKDALTVGQPAVGAKVTTGGLLFRMARPLANAARAPIAWLELSLRGLYEAGRLAATEPDPPTGPKGVNEPVAMRASEFQLARPDAPRVVDAPRREPAAPTPAAPGLSLREKTRKAVSITIGSLLVVIGILMIPLPGPGMLIALVGLAMLAKYFAWAKAMLKTVKRKVAAATKPIRKFLRGRRLAKIRARREAEGSRE